jgi:hypothetical protein
MACGRAGHQPQSALKRVGRIALWGRYRPKPVSRWKTSIASIESDVWGVVQPMKVAETAPDAWCLVPEGALGIFSGHSPAPLIHIYICFVRRFFCIKSKEEEERPSQISHTEILHLQSRNNTTLLDSSHT